VIRELIRRLSTDAEPLYECRQCGTDLAEPGDSCPNCGSGEIARYEIEE